MVQRGDYFTLLSNLAKCRLLLAKIDAYFNSSHRYLGVYERNLEDLKINLNKLEQELGQAKRKATRRVDTFSRGVAKYAWRCQTALERVKEGIADVIKQGDLAEKEIVLLEGILAEELKAIRTQEVAGKLTESGKRIEENASWMTAQGMLNAAFVDMKRLINNARIEIATSINPEIRELQTIRGAVFGQRRINRSKLSKKDTSEKEIIRVSGILRQILGHDVEVRNEEDIEGTEIKKLDEIEKRLQAVGTMLMGNINRIEKELESEKRKHKEFDSAYNYLVEVISEIADLAFNGQEIREQMENVRLYIGKLTERIPENHVAKKDLTRLNILLEKFVNSYEASIKQGKLIKPRDRLLFFTSRMKRIFSRTLYRDTKEAGLIGAELDRVEASLLSQF
jgi:hypothetical protein